MLVVVVFRFFVGGFLAKRNIAGAPRYPLAMWVAVAFLYVLPEVRTIDAFHFQHLLT